jgi:hypothetical protein
MMLVILLGGASALCNAGVELSDYQVPVMLNASNFDYSHAAAGGGAL